MSSDSIWPTDLVRRCERVAARAAAGGANHPVAAAVMMTARGHAGLSRDSFAARHDLDISGLSRAEAGEIPWHDLADVVGSLLETIPPDARLELADLDSYYQARTPQADSP